MKDTGIDLLNEVKQEIVRIQKDIVDESEYIETLLKRVSKQKGITFDSNKHEEIKQGIASYVHSLNEIMRMVDHNIEKYSESNDLEIKRFCKKMKKDLAVSSSRFNFGFETQKRQLEYLDKMFSQK